MNGTPGSDNKRRFDTFSAEAGQVAEQPSTQRLRLDASTSESADPMEVTPAPPPFPPTSTTPPNITSIVPAAINPARQLSPIERFPNELLQRIASHLNLSALGRCRQLSRHFAEVLQQPVPLAAHLNSRMVRVYAEDENYRQALELVLKQGGHFSKLKIEIGPGSAELGSVLSACHAWQELDITVGDGALPDLAPLLSNLHSGLLQAGVQGMRKLRLDLQHDEDAHHCHEDDLAESYVQGATSALTQVLKEIAASPAPVLAVLELDIANLPLTSLLEQDLTPRLASLGLDLKEQEFSQDLAALLRKRAGALQKFVIRHPPEDIGPLLGAFNPIYPAEIHLDSNNPRHACELIRLGVTRLNWTTSTSGDAGPDLGEAIGETSGLLSLKIGRHCNCGSGEVLIRGLANHVSLCEFEFDGQFSDPGNMEDVLIAKLICAAVRQPKLEKVAIAIPRELKTECQYLLLCRPGLRFKLLGFVCVTQAAKDLLAALYLEISGEQIGGIDPLPEIEDGFEMKARDPWEVDLMRRIQKRQERRLKAEALMMAGDSSSSGGHSEPNGDGNDSD